MPVDINVSTYRFYHILSARPVGGHDVATSQPPQPEANVYRSWRKTTYTGLEGGLRERKASCGGHAPGPAGQATLPCHAGATSRDPAQQASNPRPHSPTLREGGGAGRDHFLRLTHSDSSFATKPRDREVVEDCPSRLALQTNTQSLLQLFGHHSGWLACPNSCQGRNGPDGAKGCGAEAPTTGFEDKRQKLDALILAPSVGRPASWTRSHGRRDHRQRQRLAGNRDASRSSQQVQRSMGRNTSAGRRTCCTPYQPRHSEVQGGCAAGCVRQPIAHGAVAIGGGNGQAEPQPEEHAEGSSINGQPQGIRQWSIEPGASTRLLHKAGVSPLGLRSSRGGQRAEGSSIQALRENLLPAFSAGEVLCRKDLGVEVSGSQILCMHIYIYRHIHKHACVYVHIQLK